MGISIEIPIRGRSATPRSISVPVLSSQSSASRVSFTSPSQTSLATQSYNHLNNFDALRVPEDSTEDITIKLPAVATQGSVVTASERPLMSPTFSESSGLYSR